MPGFDDPINKERHRPVEVLVALRNDRPRPADSEIGGSFAAEQEIHLIAPRHLFDLIAEKRQFVSTNASPGPMTSNFFARDGIEKNGIAFVNPSDVLYR